MSIFGNKASFETVRIQALQQPGALAMNAVRSLRYQCISFQGYTTFHIDYQVKVRPLCNKNRSLVDLTIEISGYDY